MIPLPRCVLLVAVSLALAACQRAPVPAPATPETSPAPAPATPAPAPAPVASVPPPAPTPAEPDWRLPGDMTPQTSREELEQRFGKANFRSETRPGAEGMGEYEVLVLYPDDPRKRLEITFSDDRNRDLESLTVRGAQSDWRTDRGVHPGMSLAELAALNTRPVSFYGLAWDYGGTVQDWHGGMLANPVGAPTFHAVTLAARDGVAIDSLPQGDATFRSDDPKFPGIGKALVVDTVSITWPDGG